MRTQSLTSSRSGGRRKKARSPSAIDAWLRVILSMLPPPPARQCSAKGGQKLQQIAVTCSQRWNFCNLGRFPMAYKRDLRVGADRRSAKPAYWVVYLRKFLGFQAFITSKQMLYGFS